MRAVSTFATALALPMLVPHVEAWRGAETNAHIPPKWVAIPGFTASVWPKVVVLPAPVIVTVTWRAPKDNYSFAPAGGGKFITLWVELLDEHGRTIAKATKRPHGLPHMASTSIEPGKSIAKQAVLLWKWVDTRWLKKNGDHPVRGTLVIRHAVPFFLKQRPEEIAEDQFKARIAVQVRAAKASEELARAIFEEKLFTDQMSWSWASPLGKYLHAEARLKALLEQGEHDAAWQIARGLLLMHELDTLRAKWHKVDVGPRLAALTPPVEKFVDAYPNCPLSDNLRYKLGESWLYHERRYNSVTLSEMVDAVLRHHPGDDIAINAWYLKDPWKRGARWPATRPAVAPATQRCEPGP